MQQPVGICDVAVFRVSLQRHEVTTDHPVADEQRRRRQFGNAGHVPAREHASGLLIDSESTSRYGWSFERRGGCCTRNP
jgi:hypothetical protein